MLLIMLPILFVIFICLDRGLQEDRNVSEAGIVEQHAQTLLANEALSQARVDIAMTAQGHLGIVQMNDLQAREVNRLLEMLENLPRRSLGGDIMPGSPEVRGVETDAQAILVLRQ